MAHKAEKVYTIDGVREAYKRLGNVTKVVAETQAPPTTVRRHIKDLRAQYDQTPEKIVRPKGTQRTAKLAERERARELKRQGLSYKAIVKEVGVSISSVSLWCRDLLDKPNRPKRQKADPKLKDELRVEYARGEMTIKQLAEKYSIGEKILTKWCKDLIPTTMYKVRKSSERSATKLLKDADVVAMRKEVRATGNRQIQVYADRFNVSTSTVHNAQKGISFKHLDVIEAPINRQETPVKGRASTSPDGESRHVLRKRLAIEGAALHKSDPVKWHRYALAEWMSEKTGRSYLATHVVQLIMHHDPTITTLKGSGAAPRKPTVPKPAKRAARKVVSVAELKARAERAEADHREAEFIAAADAYEAWVDAGKPYDPVYSNAI